MKKVRSGNDSKMVATSGPDRPPELPRMLDWNWPSPMNR